MNAGASSVIVKILSLIAALLAVLIIAGTAAAFSTGKAHPGEGMRNADPAPESLSKETAAFTELGRLRAITKPQGKNSNGSPMIVTPWLSYPAEDKTFYEELSQKNRKIKTIITDYFSEHTKQELLKTDEKEIKSALLKKINSELVLGKITEVYFSEFIFLD